MIKKIIILLMFIFIMLCLTSCGNYQLIDLQYNFKKVHTTFDGENYKCYNITTWADYEGEQIQVYIEGYGYVLLSSLDSKLIEDKCPYCDK